MPARQPDASARVRLLAGRERSVLNRHPWVFSGAIAGIDGEPAAGDGVEVTADDGRWLARGTWSARSQIRVRIWTWDETEAIDAELVGSRVARAVAHRRRMIGSDADACRLVFSEADGLPGLIADRYGEWVVLQVSTAGMLARLDAA